MKNATESPERNKSLVQCRIISKLASRLIREETGATAIEYAILAAAIAAVIVTIVGSLGTKVVGTLTIPGF